MKRISSVDAFRGIAMILMPLDHVRDFFSGIIVNNSVFQLSWPLYFQRISAMLVPVYFSLIAGMGIFFSMEGGRDLVEKRARLLYRGIFLTLFGTFGLYFIFFLKPVLCIGPLEELGISMIVISLLLRVNWIWMMLVGAAAIIGNSLLYFTPTLSSEGVVKLMHVSFEENLFSDISLFNLYPILPWIGIMIVGYYMGMLFRLNWLERRSSFWTLSIGSFLIFLALRYINLTDPNSWSVQQDFLLTLKNFFALTKYPPSPDLLFLSLSTAFLTLGIFHQSQGFILRFLEVFGRVPMFFYIMHIILARVMASIWLTALRMPFLNLLQAFLVTILLLAIMYPLCKSYFHYKITHKGQFWTNYI